MDAPPIRDGPFRFEVALAGGIQTAGGPDVAGLQNVQADDLGLF
ncbi:hypothetical protein ABMB68_008198 [Bradyrhizobium sp. RT4a]